MTRQKDTAGAGRVPAGSGASPPGGSSDTPDLDDLELRLLGEGVYERYGYDFRRYARASHKRRVAYVRQQEKLGTITALLDRLLHEPAAMVRFLQGITVGVTALFRNPDFYAAFRAKAVPLLREVPFIRVWHAGCATGEEAYSLAIVLHEAGLHERCRIYGTDINIAALQQAKDGVYSAADVKAAAVNYVKAGGTGRWTDYYGETSGQVFMQPWLKTPMVFSEHNLVTDTSFNEFHVICCRNVMIYFDQTLQAQTHRLIYESLDKGGVLCLGDKETIRFTPHEDAYEVLDEQQKLFRKVR